MRKFISLILSSILFVSLLPITALQVSAEEFLVNPMVSAGISHTVALKENGEAWAWGWNGYGGLGDGTITDRHTPVKADITGVKQISAGGSHTVALKENGEVWAWGYNYYGQLGDGTTTDRYTSVKVDISGVKQISAGGSHTVALKGNGEVWAWGWNGYGQLGDGTATDRYTPVKENIAEVKQISAGKGHTVALKENGEVWAWGWNANGQLGDGTTIKRYTPVKADITGVKQISAGNSHTVALKGNGEVWAWGWNGYGQLGDGTATDRYTPVKVDISGVKQISAQNGYTVALKENGEVWAWGWNGYGQFGDGTATDRYTPVKADISGVKQISGGYHHTVALKENGEVWAWGSNANGQLGDGTTTNRYTPVKVDINLGKGIEKTEGKITTTYKSGLIDSPQLEFDYSDDFFVENDGYKYNHDLARATLALELSSYTADGTTGEDKTADERMANIYDAYAKLGFDRDSVEQHNYGKPLSDNSDSAAYSFASKELYDGSYLVAVVVRGGEYGGEWRSNFHVGTGSKHTGFNTPAEEVYANLSAYMSGKGYDSSNTKLWITGYSRGAAIANIVAGRVNETGLVQSKNMYAYTFATPNGVKVAETSAENEVHDNIYNIVLPYDVVPKVAMENWDYGRYGITKEFPSVNPTSRGETAHEKFFLNHTGKKYSVGIAQTKTANHAINLLSSFAENQETYVQEYESCIMDLVEWAMCRKHYQTLNEFISERYSSRPDYQYAKRFALNRKGILKYSGIYELLYFNGITRDVDEVIKPIFELISKEMNFLDSLGFYGNIKTIANAHHPEYYIAWLYAYDNPPYIYTPVYKKLTITCPVNVNVYDSAGTLVASVVDNEIVVDTLPVDVIGESAEIYFYEGEDIDDYTIEITAYDEGVVNYSVSEYENHGTETRKINYESIPVSVGTKLSGNVPKGQSLEADLYNLTSDTDGEETTIEYAEDLTGEDLNNLSVNVETEGDGTAYDLYYITKGELVTLEAKPYLDADFIGWYDENGELLSTEQEYTFVLSASMNVTAKFTKCTAKTYFEKIPEITDNVLNVDAVISAGKDIKGQYFIALYSEDDVLLGMKMADVTADADTEQDINESFDVSLVDGEIAYVKIYLWQDMKPLTVANSIDVISK